MLLVVRREGQAEVEPEQTLLDDQEDKRLHGRQHYEQQCQVADDVHGQEHGLGGPVTHAVAHEGPDTGHVQLHRLQQQQRQEEVPLMPGDEADQP